MTEQQKNSWAFTILAVGVVIASIGFGVLVAAGIFWWMVASIHIQL